ncbi:DNA adenine methylase [Candidatus Pacearchaeota archaeon]|nr:DNA adenine methylase [Candidatus Pacearchaeota archaeon]
MTFYSPLRYPGGKGKMSNYFKKVFKENSLMGGTYVEPYTGGGSVALSLLIEKYASEIIINDVDRSIYALWYSILNYTNELCELIEKTPITIKIWKKQKEIQKNKEEEDVLKLGFSTFFLNRTNRSGILGAGAIGGLEQKGNWKIDCRYNKKALIERIKKIASHKKNIQLYNLDAVKLIEKLQSELSEKTLFYLDPPYHEKGKELYLNHYDNDDHKKISLAIGKVKKQKWLITYDNTELIKKLYKKYSKLDYLLTYTAGKTKKGKELMIFSDNMKIVEYQ